MKLTIERDAFLKTLGNVKGVVEKGPDVPIFGHVTLEAKTDKLKLTGTDSGQSLTIIDVVGSEAVVQEPGGTTVPAHMLYEIIRKLPNGEPVKLDTGKKDDNLSIKAGSSSFNLGTLPLEDFPDTGQKAELPTKFGLTAKEIGELINRVRFSVAENDSRYYLGGVFLHTYADKKTVWLRTVATDGKRLARYQMIAPDRAIGMPNIIIPAKAIDELHKLSKESGEEVKVSLSDSLIQFTFGGTVITSKLIDGTFPADYERVIPTGNDKVVEADRHALAQMVDRVATISLDKERSISMEVTKGKAIFNAANHEHGLANDQLEIEYKGADMSIGYNAQYLLEILERIKGQQVKLNMADANTAIIVTEVDNVDALYILMPVRV